MKVSQDLNRSMVRVFNLTVVLVLMSLLASTLALYWYSDPKLTLLKRLNKKPQKEQTVYIPQVINGIHMTSGLIDGVGLKVVVANCTACHSAKLITQNRATKEGWKSMIRWMQKTQNLWELGDQEEVILSYLSEHYAPETQGRRLNLENVVWYEHKQSTR